MTVQCMLLAFAFSVFIGLFLQGCGDSVQKDACRGFTKTADLRSSDIDMSDGGSKWTRQHKAHPKASHDLVFAVKLKSQKQLEQMLFDRSNLLSPNYGKWLSSEEASALTLDTESVRAVHSALEAAGAVVVKTTPGGELVRARASVQIWEQFLQCEFHVYESTEQNTRNRVSAHSYNVPSNFSKYVDGILQTMDLSDFDSAHVAVSKSLAQTKILQESSTPASITPSLIRSYYKVPDVASEASQEAMMSKKVSQAVFASLGQYYSPSDLDEFQRSFDLPASDVIELDDHDMASDITCEISPNDCAEANLDVQWMTAMSPWSQMGFYYESADKSFTDFVEDLLELTKPPQVVSISYGQPEIALKRDDTLRNVFNTAAMKLGLQGVTVIVSSGDDGAQSSLARQMSCKAIQQVGLQVNWPASSPYVTAVGATMGVESGREETTCQIQCDVQGERCTSQGQGPAITSGGGFSAYDKPDYQSGHVQCQGRGVPDIALAGHAYEVVVGGEKVLVDGTSASAPTFGGMVSLVNARRLASGLSSVGFINPALYQHASAFNDIKFGNNKCGTFDAAGVAKCCGGFEAGPGWDATTGLGSVDFQKFEAIFAPVDAATTTITTSSPPVITTDAATTTATTPAGTTTATSTTTAGNMTAKKGNVLVV